MDYEIVQNERGESVFARFTGSGDSCVIPDGVTEVAEGAFINNRQIRHVDLGDVKRVGARAFQDCVKLESVKMAGVTVVGPMAFEFCGMLSDIEIGEITDIGEYAFSHCESLDFKVFPESITNVGAGAFSHTAVRRADIHWLPEIPDSLFQGCTELGYADIRSARAVGSDSFNTCLALKYLRYGDIEKIGDRAFYRCGSLEFSSLPAGLTAIGDEAIDTIRDGLVIPSGITHIGSRCMGPDDRRKSFSIYRSAVYEFRNYFNVVHTNSDEYEEEVYIRCEKPADVTILDNETGEVTGLLPLLTDTSVKMKDILYSAFRPDNTFDYNILDTIIFDRLSWRLSSRDRLAYMRLRNPFGLSRSAADRYLDYLTRHAERVAMRAVKSNEIGILALLKDYKLITSDFIDRLLGYSIANGTSDCTAFLLECKAGFSVQTESLFDDL